MDESIALVEFSKPSQRACVKTFEYAHIEVGLKIWFPHRWLCYAIYHDEPVLVCAGNLAISIMVLIGMICLVVGMINYNKWRMTKSMGNAMFVSYGFFVAQDLIRVFLPNVFGGDC